MSKISKLFDIRSKEYDHIYADKFPKKLLHQEKIIRATLVEKLIFNRLSSSKKQVILDVGCGMGNVLLSLRKNGLRAKMYGIDISPDMIKLANQKLDLSGYEDINFVTGNLENISINANVVLSLGVLGYQTNQEEFLQDLSNMVDQDGYLIFTTANGDSFLRLARRYLSKLHSLIKRKTKSKGIEFLPIRDRRVENTIAKNGFKLEKKIYITFGLGLFTSSVECFMDRLLFRYFSNNIIGKYFSLTVIYAYKKK